jgi:glycosyltransferase 2 family protein
VVADLKESSRSRFLRRMVVAARRFFMPVAIAFLIFAAYSARDVVGQVLVQARAGPLVFAVLGWSALSLVVPLVSWTVLRGTGVDIDYRTVLRIYLDRLPARYLPGGIWQTVSRVVDLHGLGVSKSQLSLLVVVENFGSLATALIAGGMFVLLAGSVALSAETIICGGVLLAAVLPWASRRFVGAACVPLQTYLISLGIMTTFWLLAATLFVIYWSAFPALELEGNMFSIYGAYLLAWAVGFLAIFAPQGVGVFEGVAGLLLKAEFSLAGMAVLVAGFRVVMLAGDGVAYMSGRLVRRPCKN